MEQGDVFLEEYFSITSLPGSHFFRRYGLLVQNTVETCGIRPIIIHKGREERLFSLFLIGG